MTSADRFFLRQDSFDEFLLRLRETFSSKSRLSIDEFVHFVAGFEFAAQLPDTFLIQLFEALSDDNESAELRRLAVACSLFCEEESELWMLKIIHLFQDSDHPIRLREATAILTCLFLVYFLLIPTARQRLGCPPDQYAYRMILSLAKDKVKAESLSIEDMLLCFNEGIQGFKESSPFLMEEEESDLSEGQVILRSLLEGVEGQDIVLLLQTYIDEEGILTFASFLFGVETILKRKTRQVSLRQQLALDSIIRRVFEVYDQDTLDAVLFEDIVCGLLLFTRDSSARKAEILTDLYCPEGECSVSRTAIEATVEAILKLVVALDPDFLVGTSLADLVQDILKHIHATMDQHDEDIAVSAFQYWISFVYRHFGKLQHESSCDDSYEGYVYEDEAEDQLAKIDDNQVLSEMEYARKLLHLENISSMELEEIIYDYSINGEICRRDFLLVFDLLCSLQGEDLEDDSAAQLSSQIFGYFDDNGVADSKDVLCGLILLTDSSPIDKLAAIFGLLKADSEGDVLSSYEMQKLFLHCLRVLMCCSKTAAGKVSGVYENLEDLAQHAMTTSFRFLGLSPLENIDFDGLKRIADRCVALSYT